MPIYETVDAVNLGELAAALAKSAGKPRESVGGKPGVRQAGESTARQGAQPAAAHETAQEAARDRAARQLFADFRNLVVTPVCDIQTNQADWLWPGRIRRGELTLLAGDSSVGKSLVALDMAARVSRGAPWPDSPNEPQTAGNVLALTAHDDPAAFGRPRLERAGADLSRVFFATGVQRRENASCVWKRQISLPDDLMSLAKTIYEKRPMPLVVLDPAWVFFGRGRGRSKLAGPALLAELAELASDMQVAMLCVTDLRRDGGPHGYRAAGDRALVAAAPTAWGLVRHPKEPEQRLMLPLKMNAGPAQAGLAFEIVDGRVEWDPAPTTLTGAAVLAAESSGTNSEGAEEWLKAYLADGPQPAKEIFKQGRECGFSAWALRQAKSELGVDVEKQGFDRDARWVWSLGRDEEKCASAISRTFDENAASSSDLGRIFDGAENSDSASSIDESQHVRPICEDSAKMRVEAGEAVGVG
jgi:hypothetical protein